MKTLKWLSLVIYLFIAIVPLKAQNDWVWQNPLPQGKNIYAGQVLSKNSAYACGQNGLFIRTLDNGSTYDARTIDLETDLNALYFFNSTSGIVAGDNGKIYKTNDPTLTFTKVFEKYNYSIKSVAFFSTVLGVAVGTSGLILRTTDAGSTWIELKTTGESFSSVAVFENVGIAVGELGTVYVSNDIGQSWQKRGYTLSTLLSAVTHINGANWVAADKDGAIYKSANNGADWVKIGTIQLSWIKSIKFFDPLNAVAVGYPGVIAVTSDGGYHWELKAKYSEYNISNVSIYIENGVQTAWLFGDFGLLMSSVDNGFTWSYKSYGYSENLNSVYFTDKLNGWVVGNNGLLLHTTNGGIRWNKIETGTTKNIFDIYMRTPARGFLCGQDGVLFETLDSGYTWVNRHIDTLVGENLYSIEGTKWSVKVAGEAGTYLQSVFDGDNYTWILDGFGRSNLYSVYSISSKVSEFAGDGGVLVKYYMAPDGPRTIYAPISGEFDMRSVVFGGGGTGWATGKYGLIVKTTNAGVNWKIIDTLGMPWLNSIYFPRSNDIGFACGSNGSIVKSIDSGMTWQTMPTSLTNQLHKIFFPTPDTGWVVGANGLILKTIKGGGSTSGGLPSSLDEKSTEIADFELSQNYPNPFNPVTEVKFTLTTSQHITLTVYDILGNKVKELINEFKAAGKYSYPFDGSGLASGVYIYSLKSGSYSVSKKMVLLK